MNIKTTILEICEVFEMKYNELFSTRVPAFVRAVWELIGTSSLAVREDTMVAQAIKFLSITAKMGIHKELFADEGTLQGLAQRIIVPSMPLRGKYLTFGLGVLSNYWQLEHEVEQFEDDPLEYIRRDLSLSTEGGGSRRHAASELIRALISIGLDAPVTRLIEQYIGAALQVSRPLALQAMALIRFGATGICSKPGGKLEVQGHSNLPPDRDRLTNLNHSCMPFTHPFTHPAEC